MQNDINFLILTKSARFGGNCVVGIDLDSKKLIRLVSDNEKLKNSISDVNMICKNGEFAIPTDIVKIRIVKPIPTKYQPENVLLDSSYKWQKIKKASFKDIIPYISNEDYVYINTLAYLTESNIEYSTKSILIIRAKDIKIHTQIKCYDNGEIKEKTKIDFTYNSRQYVNISITDRDYFSKNCNINNALLVISLPSEAYNGYYYKFVAKIFVIKEI